MKEELKTGYPHKDKMWLKYYDSEFLKRKNPNAGLYERKNKEYSRLYCIKLFW